MRTNELSEKDNNIYANLSKESHATMKHINAGSYQTKYRYMSSVDQFCMFLAKDFKKQSLKNMKFIHFKGFVDHMKNEGKSKATIETDMAGVRYYFDHSSRGRIKVPTNKELDVQPRTLKDRINVNRAMPYKQFVELIDIAKEKGLKDKELQLSLGYDLGLRIHEIVGINRYNLKKAIEADDKFRKFPAIDPPYIKVKGKGGLIRYVPIETEEQINTIKRVYEYSEPGKVRVFENGTKMHNQIKSLQKFISDHRNEKLSAYKVTAHSLRHSFTQNTDKRYKDEGIGEKERKSRITKSLGHGRLNVVDIYLEDVEDWN